MKLLFGLLSALILSACSSTPVVDRNDIPVILDREWAMEEIRGRNNEKTQIIVTPAPTVNVTVNAAPAPAPIVYGGAPARSPNYEPVGVCKSQPVYTIDGTISHYEDHCFGGKN